MTNFEPKPEYNEDEFESFLVESEQRHEEFLMDELVLEEAHRKSDLLRERLCVLTTFRFDDNKAE